MAGTWPSPCSHRSRNCRWRAFGASDASLARAPCTGPSIAATAKRESRASREASVVTESWRLCCEPPWPTSTSARGTNDAGSHAAPGTVPVAVSMAKSKLMQRASLVGTLTIRLRTLRVMGVLVRLRKRAASRRNLFLHANCGTSLRLGIRQRCDRQAMEEPNRQPGLTADAVRGEWHARRGGATRRLRPRGCQRTPPPWRSGEHVDEVGTSVSSGSRRPESGRVFFSSFSKGFSRLGPEIATRLPGRQRCLASPHKRGPYRFVRSAKNSSPAHPPIVVTVHRESSHLPIEILWGSDKLSV